MFAISSSSCHFWKVGYLVAANKGHSVKGSELIIVFGPSQGEGRPLAMENVRPAHNIQTKRRAFRVASMRVGFHPASLAICAVSVERVFDFS